MTAKDWLRLLAAQVAHRLPGNAAHLGAYAVAVAEKVPGHWLTAEMAQRVEPYMLDRMKLPELLAVIRQEGGVIPAPDRSSPSSWVKSDDEKLADRWFDYAMRRMANGIQGGEPADLVHLLSLLRTYSPKAWERFTEIHAPDVLAARRAQVAEIMARRRGELPALGIPRVGKAMPGPQRYQASAQATEPALRSPLPSQVLNDQLRIAARGGDDAAAAKLHERTGEVVGAHVVIEHQPDEGRVPA